MSDNEAESVYVLYLMANRYAPESPSKTRTLAAVRSILEKHGYNFSDTPETVYER